MVDVDQKLHELFTLLPMLHLFIEFISLLVELGVQVLLVFLYERQVQGIWNVTHP
jgi:hypothetical protein